VKPTPKELAIRAIGRTTDAVFRDADRVPRKRWEEPAAPGAGSLRTVLTHLIFCEDWWLISISIPEGERPPVPDLAKIRSAKKMLDVLRAAREHLLEVLRGLPNTFFERPVPTCQYGDLKTGADLMLYAAEHDYYHVGQINTLTMAFGKG